MFRQHTTTLSTFILFMLITFCSGCMTTFIRDTHPQQQALLDVNTEEISTIQLKTLSATEPVSLDEASQQYLQEIQDWRASTNPFSLSLAEARASTLVNNLELQVQVIEPSLAAQEVNIERAKFETLFLGGFNHAESKTPTASQLASSQSTVTRFNLGLLQPLPSGGEFSVAFPSTRFETNNEFSLLNPAYDVDLSFSFSQPLLRNAGFKTNTHSIRVAKLQQKMTDARTKLEAIRILASVDQAYWRVYGASRELEIRNQQYELALRQLHEARLRVQAKAAARIEITRAESGVAARLEGIINSLTNLRLVERDLKQIMNHPNLPIDTTIPLDLTDNPNPLGLNLQPNDIARFAVQNRMEVLELELRLALDESSIAFARNQRLPVVSLDTSYNVNGLGSNFGSAYEQIGKVDYCDWFVGFSSQIPIGNQASTARLRQALLLRSQHHASRELREQLIQLEVLNAIDRLSQNWQRILAARQEVIFAARTFEAERRQFELNIRTSTDVLDAAARLAEAQSREIRSLIEYEFAQIEIALATGTLLGHGKILWEPVNTPES